MNLLFLFSPDLTSHSTHLGLYIDTKLNEHKNLTMIAEPGGEFMGFARVDGDSMSGE